MPINSQQTLLNGLTQIMMDLAIIKTEIHRMLVPPTEHNGWTRMVMVMEIIKMEIALINSRAMIHSGLIQTEMAMEIMQMATIPTCALIHFLEIMLT